MKNLTKIDDLENLVKIDDLENLIKIDDLENLIKIGSFGWKTHDFRKHPYPLQFQSSVPYTWFMVD